MDSITLHWMRQELLGLNWGLVFNGNAVYLDAHLTTYFGLNPLRQHGSKT
jgi:hypothetical protein